MSEIRVEHHPSEDRLDALGVRSWPIWSKEISEFPWRYDSAETCYFLERDAIAFGVLFLVLVVRPRGLLGQAATREA